MTKKTKILLGFFALILIYIFFFRGNGEYIFQAKDIEIKNITSKGDFEKIIVKGLYDKIVESCKKTKDREKNYYGRRGIYGDNRIRLETLKGADSSGGFFHSFGGRETSSNIRDITKNTVESVSFNGGDITTKSPITFSKTNIQKKNVDEGDILKQTKDYIFYFSKKQAKIFIIKSPLNGKKIDLKNIVAIKTIKIPNNLLEKAELFVNENRLVYLASKKSYGNNNTIVGIYDISNLKKSEIKVVKIFETKGDFFKSRLIDNNLYIISDYSIKPLKDKICNKINQEETGRFLNFVKYFTGIDFKLRNSELYNDFKEELETYSYKFNSEELESSSRSEKLEKINLFYTKKDLAGNISNLNFNIISVIDIDKKETKNTQHLLFGDLDKGEIHMTLNNLYLVNSYYNSEKWNCDFDRLCYRKNFESGNFTSISKLELEGKNLKYKKSMVIPGRPINQYSMDEDQGYFRIFTTSGIGKTGTSLYIFSPKFELSGKLEKIKAREKFKSSRFIGDKAFLVTFEQIDPLFVIDLHNPAKPKIIGELEIPGYSTYLHPYGTFGNKQYLIGLGEENSNVKIDLYEIDYAEKALGGNISVKQKYSKKLEKNSWTPALENPRTFVWDKEEKKLYLPFSYKKYYDNSNNFSGIIGLKINKDEGIKEFFRKGNFSKQYYLSDLKNSNPRVGYYKGENKTYPFFINSDFIFFVKLKDKDTDKEEEKYLFFDENLRKKYKKIIEEQKEENLRNIEKVKTHNDLDF